MQLHIDIVELASCCCVSLSQIAIFIRVDKAWNMALMFKLSEILMRVAFRPEWLQSHYNLTSQLDFRRMQCLYQAAGDDLKFMDVQEFQKLIQKLASQLCTEQ